MRRWLTVLSPIRFERARIRRRLSALFKESYAAALAKQLGLE